MALIFVGDDNRKPVWVRWKPSYDGGRLLPSLPTKDRMGPQSWVMVIINKASGGGAGWVQLNGGVHA